MRMAAGGPQPGPLGLRQTEKPRRTSHRRRTRLSSNRGQHDAVGLIQEVLRNRLVRSPMISENRLAASSSLLAVLVLVSFADSSAHPSAR